MSEVSDSNEPPNDEPTVEQRRELLRLIVAMQTALCDDTLSPQFREQTIRDAFSCSPPYAMIVMAATVASRTRRGMRSSRATELAPRTFLDMLPGVDTEVAAPCVALCELYLRSPAGSADGDALVLDLLSRGRGVEAFMALITIAGEMAWMAVQFSPVIRTRQDLVRHEAIEMEQRFIAADS